MKKVNPCKKGWGARMTKDDKNTKKVMNQQKVSEQHSEVKIVRKLVLIVSLSIFIIIGIIAGGGYFYIKSALKPVDSNGNVQKLIEIPMGATVSGISEMLESNGIIKDARVFKYYVKFKNEAGFMAGVYKLSPSMNISEIVNHLKTGKVSAAVTITIPEGKQLSEIAHIIAVSLNKPDREVLNQLKDKDFIKTLMNKYPDILTSEILNSNIMYPLEGYLYPATYSFYKINPSVDEVVAAMLDKTNNVMGSYQDQIKQKQLTIHQLLTFSSLIEEEATEKADRHKISSVFYNRIQKGMPLQTDPTVLYAQGKHKDKVLYQDLEVNSPYNTYKNTGLPPGPISNAGNVSIEAALNPAQTDFYYFLAAADGSVIFTKTLDEHNREKAKHISNKK